MNFLLKLAFAAGFVSPLAAAPHVGTGGLPISSEAATVTSTEEKSKGTPNQDLIELAGMTSYTIKNPYSETVDKPFTIETKSMDQMAAPLATKVTCGTRDGQPVVWTDGEYLGQTGDGKKAYTKIVENRVYFNWGGTVSGNIFVLFFLDLGKFPNNSENDALIKQCVNPVDPSTAANNLLGTSNGKITCNGYVMENGELLGTFVDNGASTFQYTKYVDGRLRVMIKQGANDTRTDNYSMDLLPETINGTKGSLSDKWKGKLTLEMVNGCYWPIVPKSATPVVENNCPANPAISDISSIQQTSLRFTFTGDGISTLRWRIKSGSSVLRNGTTSDLGSNKTVNLSYGSLNPGNYSLEIEGASCTSGVASRSFTIQEPVVVIPDCQGGPSVTTIRNLTSTGLTVDYAGTNLRNFSWRILDGSSSVANGSTGVLQSNTANISYNYLQNGTYTFEMKALDCKAASVATKNFTLSGDTRPTCKRGPTLQALLSSDDRSLSFLFDGDEVYSIDWKIMSGNNAIRQSSVSPQNNHPVIQYDPLQNGSYTIQIEGGSCKSAVTSATFAIGPLPIYVANFVGETVEEGVKLSWEVVSEQDGKEFEVLRYDSEMKNAEVLGKVSLSDQRTGWYHFVDSSPLLGINYYQLKQIDIDGTFTKSKIVSVNPGIIRGTVVAPNPAQDYVDLQFSSRTAGKSEVVIYNAAGVAIGKSPIQITEGKNVHRVNVKKLVNGSYFMKISHDGELSSLRFMKMD
ncbi:T9SS type A sorting domain-containing protein [Dyadobacter crusticola]|uniref:T9SS type A sorting domain-containing protein n=1 Tax=Dyadobacter crusticola TaxID=292407 RepID=UPI0004E19144|nr:T9SS type A sorting domain-containing protein [Dyadobacter crusticola]